MKSDFLRDDLTEQYYKSLKGKAAIDARIKEARLPMIDIAGEIFFSRVAFGILSSKDHIHADPIRIDDIEMHPVTKKLLFYYHIPTIKRVTIPEDITELPKNVVRVEIPNMYFLDPVGMARRNDKELRYYLSGGYLVQRMFRKARIIPLEKTELVDLICKNNEKKTEEITSKQKLQPPLRKPVRKTGKRKGL